MIHVQEGRQAHKSVAILEDYPRKAFNDNFGYDTAPMLEKVRFEPSTANWPRGRQTVC